MKVLLINSNQLKAPYPVIPFGLLSIASSIDFAGGHEVKVLDLCFSEDCPKDIINAIKSNNPDVIGISIRNIDNCSAYSLKFFPPNIKNNIILPCKKFFNGPIIIGGPAVGINGYELLSFLDLEFAIHGDGEIVIVEFLDRLKNNKPLDNLGGLIWRKNGRLYQDNPPLRVIDLDTMPVPVPSRYINIQPYVKVGSPLQIQTKRGCALKCTYCTYNRLEGEYYRFRSPQKVADEIELLVKETGIKDIEFTDSTFNIPLKHAKNVLRAIIDKNMDVNLSTVGMNPGAIDKELIDLIKKLHFRNIAMAIESGSDVTIKSLGKNFTKEDILRVGKLLHDNGLNVSWTLILGAPDETENTIKETFNTIDKLAKLWDFVLIAPGLRVYNKTPISYNMLQNKAECTKDNFLTPIFYSSDAMDLEKLHKIIKRAVFYRYNCIIVGEPLVIPPIAFRILTALNNLFGLNYRRQHLIILYTMLKRIIKF